jgi:hypothetical protein
MSVCKHRGTPLMGNSVPFVKQSEMSVLAALLVVRIVTSFIRNGGNKPRLVIIRLRVRSSIVIFCASTVFVVVSVMMKYGMCPAVANRRISLPSPSMSARSVKRQWKNPDRELVPCEATSTDITYRQPQTYYQSRRLLRLPPSQSKRK